MRGVNAPELRTQVDLLLFEAFPRELYHRLPVHRLTSVDRLSSCALITLPALFGSSVNGANHVQDNCFSRCSGDQTVSFH